MTREEFQEIAWRDFILWAFEEPGMVDAFNKATGRSFAKDTRAPLDRMIDRATGHEPDQSAAARAFLLWVTEHHWGVDEAPQTVRAEIAAARRDSGTSEKPAAGAGGAGRAENGSEPT